MLVSGNGKCIKNLNHSIESMSVTCVFIINGADSAVLIIFKL